MISSNKGSALVDTIVAVFILSVTALIFGATFPTGIRSYGTAHSTKVAAALAQKKMEEARSIKYETLTSSGIISSGLFVGTETPGTYSFTSLENLPGLLPSGTGTMTVSNISSDLKRIVISVQWKSAGLASTQEIKIVSYVADKRPRRWMS